MAGTLWPRDGWLDAMWDDDTIRPNERVVAMAYARFAGSRDLTWCTWEELKRRTGLRSNDAINRAIKGLLDGGWLVEVEPARQHYSARYRLIQPSVSRTPEPDPIDHPPVDGGVDNAAQQYGKRSAEPLAVINNGHASTPFNDTSSPFRDSSTPFNGTDSSNTELKHRDQRLGRPAPRPRGPEPTQAPSRTDHDPSLAKAGHDQTRSVGNQQTARAETRRAAELQAVAAMGCPQCDDDGRLPDGTTCGHDPPNRALTAVPQAQQRKDPA